MDRKILIRLFLLFIPVSYASYLFHEFGHWIIGEVLGNNMVFTLNNVWPKNGYYINEIHSLYVTIGGPAFTIIQSLIFLLIIEKYKMVYVYPLIFFPMFTRFFSIFLGEFSIQDEAKISALLELGTYTIAGIVLSILIVIVLRGSYRLKISLKNNLDFLVVCTLCQLLVIETYKVLSRA